MRKSYVPVPIVATDKRRIFLKFHGYAGSVETEITQLDLLQIMTYIRGKNDRLHGLFTRYIKACDDKTGEKTNFERQVPRRKAVGELL